MSISKKKFNKLVSLYYESPEAYLRDVKGYNYTITNNSGGAIKQMRPVKMELF